MGCAPIAHVLFSKFMKFDTANPKWVSPTIAAVGQAVAWGLLRGINRPARAATSGSIAARVPPRCSQINRDRFVLSNGHACALLYSMLHLSGYSGITLDDLKKFRQLDSVCVAATNHHAHRPRNLGAQSMCLCACLPPPPRASVGAGRRATPRTFCTPPLRCPRAPWARASPTPWAWPSRSATWRAPSTTPPLPGRRRSSTTIRTSCAATGASRRVSPRRRRHWRATWASASSSSATTTTTSPSTATLASPSRRTSSSATRRTAGTRSTSRTVRGHPGRSGAGREGRGGEGRGRRAGVGIMRWSYGCWRAGVAAAVFPM